MRRLDWQARMWLTLTQQDDREFAWGRFDCVRMAAEVVDAIRIDSRMLDRVAEMYVDKRSALRLIMRNGLDELVTRELAVESAARALARQGDVVSVDLESGPSIGVCVGFKVAVAAAPSGIAYLPLERAHSCWMIE